MRCPRRTNDDTFRSIDCPKCGVQYYKSGTCIKCGMRLPEPEEPDQWRRATWLRPNEGGEKRALLRVAEMAETGGTCAPHWGVWLDDDTKPARTCTHCGGAHPDDAIALVEAGWDVVPTDKDYKRYLQRGTWRPTPSVKVYTYHFTEEQVNRFNAALR